MKHSGTFLTATVFLAAVTAAFCDTDLRQILVKAAHKYAWDHQTEIDAFLLAGGFCFSSSDQSQGEQTCQTQQGVHWLDYGTAVISRSYITRRSLRPQTHEIETELKSPLTIDDFNITHFTTIVSLAEKAAFTKNISVQVDLTVLDEADPPLYFMRNGSHTIDTRDISQHDSVTDKLTDPPEISPTHTGCLLRKYRVVEIDTDFILEYIVPLHGNIIVAFKDAVSMPRQEGLRKFGALPVDLLLRIAKSMGDAPTFEVPEIGFPMYRGVIEVMDRGATEELKFRGCKKNELPVSSATAPLAAGK